MLPGDRVPSSAPLSPTSTPSHKIGPFDVTQDENEFSLRLENGGEVGIRGCFLFFFGMLCVLFIGFMSILQAAQSSHASETMDAARFFSPTVNILGFIWLVLSLLMLIGVPVYAALTYRSALVFRFNRRDDAFYRGRGRVCHLRRIENLTIQEDKDPDLRYLYVLELVYNDGHKMLLHNGYEERDTMNLANELSSFLGVKVVWAAAPDRK